MSPISTRSKHGDDTLILSVACMCLVNDHVFLRTYMQVSLEVADNRDSAEEERGDDANTKK